MVKIRKSKKIKEEVLPIENADALSKKISQSEEFVKKKPESNCWYFGHNNSCLIIFFFI